MGLFDWLFPKKSDKSSAKTHVYINSTSTPIVFIPYSDSDPSNVRLQPKTAKIVSFPGFVYQDFECRPDNLQKMLNTATSIHICNSPEEQYYYDVSTKTLYYRKQGGGDISKVTQNPGVSIEQQVLQLASNNR